MQFVVRSGFFAAGLWLLGFTFISVVRTFVVPRSEKVLLTRLVFGGMRILFNRIVGFSRSYLFRDQLMALYAPLGLLALTVTGITLMFTAYWAMFIGLGLDGATAWALSGSFLLTLGSASGQSLPCNLLGYTESVIGLIMIALLVSFLPTIYTAFSKREVLVTRLEFRAGSPPSGVEFLARLYRLGEVLHLEAQWPIWENWFVEVEESHTSLFPLALFRSPKPHRSWVNAAGAVLDAAALALSTVDGPPNYHAEMCYLAGVSALGGITGFFDLRASPAAADTTAAERAGAGLQEPISVTEEQYKLACLKLGAQGVPLRRDREQAWQDFRKYRSGYDRSLLALAALTMAPEGTWSG